VHKRCCGLGDLKLTKQNKTSKLPSLIVGLQGCNKDKRTGMQQERLNSSADSSVIFGRLEFEDCILTHIAQLCDPSVASFGDNFLWNYFRGF
jgi:hypothetical protein